jgi:hypothetical protein
VPHATVLTAAAYLVSSDIAPEMKMPMWRYCFHYFAMNSPEIFLMGAEI